jgi:membrane protease YdiL (CAAX protease family)
VIAAVPARGTARAPLLVVAVGAATAVRVLVGAPVPAASVPAAVLFSGVLLAAVAVAPGGLERPAWSQAALGVAGGAALVAVSLVALPAIRVEPRSPAATLLWWVPLVAVVAASEELVLRGVLFSALRSRHGDAAAVAVTAALFAVIHLPLYGLGALPIDLCAGLFLGALRVASGAVTAPVVAHVLADVATGWLP